MQFQESSKAIELKSINPKFRAGIIRSMIDFNKIKRRNAYKVHHEGQTYNKNAYKVIGRIR